MPVGPDHPAWQRLWRYTYRAIGAQPALLAAKLSAMVDADQYRLQTHVDTDADGQVDPNTLTFVVQFPTDDGGWATLCTVHHSLLGLPDDEVTAEAESLMWQHGIGIPDDPSSITDPPPATPEA
jgi:hypothetical protein